MYKIQHLDLEHLTPLLCDRLQKLTTKEFECCLKDKDPYEIPNSQVVAFAAFNGDEPVGLILAVRYPLIDTADIHSIFVSEEYRRRGIGTLLTVHLLDYLPATGTKFAMIKYPSSGSYTPYLEKILQDTRWDPSAPFVIKCFFDCYQFHPGWFEKPFELPQGFSLFMWKDRTLKDRSRLEYLVNQRGIIASVDPLLKEELMEPINSLGIRYQDELVGWMVTHRIDEKTICYAKLFILKEHQHSGSAIMMLIRSIQLQQKSPVQYSMFEVNLKQTDSRWHKFVRTKLKPNAQSVEEISIAFCDLASRRITGNIG